MREQNKTAYTVKYYWQGFWALGKGYWQSAEKKKAFLLLGVVLLMTVGSVALTVALNDWYKEFWNVLQEYQYELFWPLVGKFSLLAGLFIALGVYSVYLQQMLLIKWRTWMTEVYLERWMKGRAYHMLKVLGYDMDNPDQRISEDIKQFVNLTLSLSIGFIRQLMSLSAFIVILWNLSEVLYIPLGEGSLPIYGYMVWLSLLYSIGGTYLAHMVGRALIKLDFEQQRYEADFRFNMMRVREYSESIALYGGEAPELQGFGKCFTAVILNFRHIMTRQKILNGFTNGYLQLAIIIPILLVSPRWFAHAAPIGWIMQVINAFGRVQDGMSYFVTAYDTLAQWCSVVRRLYDFELHMQSLEMVESEVTYTKGQTMAVNNLHIYLPQGRTLLADGSIDFDGLGNTLLMGPSGCGKSTIFRTMAGLWPYATGTVQLPQTAKVLFLSQKPYLPLGTLRQAIFYPQLEDFTRDEEVKELLRRCKLEMLLTKLDVVDDWSRILSLGEQQRVAFLRLFLYKPQLAFLDEATSAMDEDLENHLYGILKTYLPEIQVISIGHRRTLRDHHQTLLKLDGQGGWEVIPLTQA